MPSASQAGGRGGGSWYVGLGVGTLNAIFEAKQGGSARFIDPHHRLV
jgi:hypothetical protein